MISRMRFTEGLVLNDGSWSAKVEELMKTEPKVLIRLFRKYDPLTRELYLDVEIACLSKGNANYRLALYMLEDSIVKPQIDKEKTPPDVENYVHNNVLRGSITGTWGEQLSTTEIPAGYILRREYYYTIPEGKDWRLEKMKILAFVHELIPEKSYEILQAEEINLID